MPTCFVFLFMNQSYGWSLSLSKVFFYPVSSPESKFLTWIPLSLSEARSDPIYNDQPGYLTPKDGIYGTCTYCVYPSSDFLDLKKQTPLNHLDTKTPLTNGSPGHVVLHFLVIVHGRVLSAWYPGSPRTDGWVDWLRWIQYDTMDWWIWIHALVVSFHTIFPWYNYR